MPYILCYTKRGAYCYPDHNYPGHIALNCDWEHAVHLALSEDGHSFTPLRNNTGILFAKATFDEGPAQGTTKTLIDPWLFRRPDGGFGVCAVRRNQNAPDPLSDGSIAFYTSSDLVRYREAGFLKLSDRTIRRPRCEWNPDRNAYRLYWECDGRAYSAWSGDLICVEGTEESPLFAPPDRDYGIEGCVPGNVLEVSVDEARIIRNYLGEIRCIGVQPAVLTIGVGEELTREAMPGITCVYTDGSTHKKAVDWDDTTVASIDTARPGTHRIPGRIRQKRWKFPYHVNHSGPSAAAENDPNLYIGMSDPCIISYRGKYYLSSSGTEDILLRCADTIEETFGAEPVAVHHIPLNPGEAFSGSWAAELHEIDGVLYMFVGVCPGSVWTRVRSCVLRCNGDPLDPAAWEAPRLCTKPDGNILTEGGISLDMTWFRDGGRDYVMWSDRKIRYDTDPLEIGPADIYIATIDPKAPWQTTSEPVCILRPMYGWDRYETEVDEGPYLLRHGSDLFVTISGSSTGMGDLYDVGLLRATSGKDLLNPDNWDWLPYPLLTKESVPGEYGPGHNSFITDPETGDDLMVYHAIPHDEKDRTLYRQPGIRRVHWAATGLPYLEMTPERDLPPEGVGVEMTLVVE